MESKTKPVLDQRSTEQETITNPHFCMRLQHL